MRIILSFNSRDLSLAEAFRATLFVHAPDLEVFFSPSLLEEHRSLHLNHAEAILLVVGPHGLSQNQTCELRLAQNRQQHSKTFKMVPILAAGGTIPEHLEGALAWIPAPVVTDGKVVNHIVDMLRGGRERRVANKKLPLWHRLGGAA